MRVIKCANYDEVSKAAAKIVASQVILKPNCVLGLATGSTPLGLYENLAEMNAAGEVDFANVVSFNLDEYYPISKDNDQSYNYYMKENLFSKININIENTAVPNGETNDPAAECASYEERIAAAGGVDLQVLGIGQNGHVGFNEPDEYLVSDTHVTGLTESTISANARFFDKIEDVPTKAITMGMATIMKARKVVLLASGKSKQGVISDLINNDNISTSNPSSMLKMHPDLVIICDKEALGE